MKLYQIALLLFIVSYVYTDTDCNLISNPTKKSDCNEKLSAADKANKIEYCCYAEVGELKACVGYTKELYDAIGEAKKSSSSSDTSSSVKGKIECNSQYLTFGVITLLLYLL